MNERQEGSGELVVSRGDASEVLDAVEKAFDQIAALVEMLVEIPRIEPVGARRYNRFAALSLNQFDEGIRVVSLVGHDVQSRLIRDQRSGMLDVGHLASRENDAQRIAQGVDGHVQFGGQSAPRTADLLRRSLFFGQSDKLKPTD